MSTSRGVSVAWRLDGESIATTSAHVPGEPGLWVLLFGDMALFTLLFMFYLHERGQNRRIFAESQDHLHRNIGAINTVVLLTSSIFVVFALRALRNARMRHLAMRLALTAIAMGTCFVGLKLFEYYELVSAGITLSSNRFYMHYFVITGLHLGHVVLGLLTLVVLSRLVRNVETASVRMVFFEGGACFWHLVDLVWIVIFPLIYLVR